MLRCAALLLLVAAALCPAAQGRAAVIGLSGDDTRHGIEVLYGNFGTQVELIRYHIDTLIQTRFARTVIEAEIRNNGPAQKTTVPFAIPENAMLVNFEIDDSNGKVHQARPMLRDALQVEATGSSSQIKARNTEAFDVELELTEGGSILLRVVYEELLTRKREKYTNVQQVWPGSVVADLKLTVRIKESSDITSGNYTFTTENANAVVETSVQHLVSANQRSTSEVVLTLQPTPSEQRDVASQLGLSPEVGFAGQFNVEYDVARYPTAGDIVVRDGYFAHFFAPAGLQAIPKYALFLLDVSGSMGGRKIEQLQDAMVTILGQIGPNDLFTVIEFSDGNKMWDLDGSITTTPSPYSTAQPPVSGCKAYTSEYIVAAQQTAQTMRASGGTALLGGLQQAIACAASGPAGLEPTLMVLTDGQPNEPIDQIQTATTAANQPTGNTGDLVTSIFTLALGDDANDDFLRELALRNGGTFTKIYEAGDAAVELSKFYESISSPLLTDVSVVFDYQQAVESSVTQKDFRTYYWGSELVVAGRIQPGQGDSLSGVVTATGIGGATVTYPIQVSAQPSWQPETLGGQANSERLWAFLYTKQLLDEEVVDGPASAAANSSIDMALLYSFVTPHTCLAVDIINPYEAPTQSPQPADPTTPAGPPTSTGPATPPAPPTGASTPPQPASTTGPTYPPTQRPTTTPLPYPRPYTGPTPPTGRPGPPGPTPPAPTGRPGPPGPTPPAPTGRPGPNPPAPTGPPSAGGRGNTINIGSITVGNMTVNGPLIQFNLRR